MKIRVHLDMLKEMSIWITKYVFLFFPNFKQNAAIFPNSKGPSPKKGCESPVKVKLLSLNFA